MYHPFSFRTHDPLSRPARSRSAAPYGLVLLPGLALVLFAMASAAFAQSEPSNLGQWIGVDLLQLIRNSDAFGKVSLTVLAGFSVASWMVIVYKYLHIRQAGRQSDHFVDACNQGSGQLEEAFEYSSQYPDSPLAQIFREAYLELDVESWYREGYGDDVHRQAEVARVGLERVFERTITNEISHLESKLIFLATTASVCPFIGLFGTVWGVMIAFQAMAQTQSAALSSLAPGIATALLCVVGGLFCAIPATVFYNYLNHRVRVLTSRMDAFAHELFNVILKQILKQPVSVPEATSVR